MRNSTKAVRAKSVRHVIAVNAHDIAIDFETATTPIAILLPHDQATQLIPLLIDAIAQAQAVKPQHTIRTVLVAQSALVRVGSHPQDDLTLELNVSGMSLPVAMSPSSLAFLSKLISDALAKQRDMDEPTKN
jgi:hypothetical protein